ncbi:MAG: hypothetical protein ABSH22_01480 [Tepidisphaeraceae bacterium]|jgi:hypothetical protein
MKPLLRLIGHILVLVIGIFIGVLWGVNHPTQAADINQQEQIAATKAKIELLEKFGGSIPNGQQMLDDEKKKLDAVTTQPTTP